MIYLLIPFLFLLLLPYLLLPKPKPPHLHTAYDFILILGCPTQDDGSLSKAQKKRLSAAKYYIKQNTIPYVVISGNAVKNNYGEAESMAEVLAQEIVLPIKMETEARNTYQNIQFTKQSYGQDHILIVTTPAHLRRTAFFAKKFYPNSEIGSANLTDPYKEYSKEYLRMWNALYWEVRLFFKHKWQ